MTAINVTERVVNADVVKPKITWSRLDAMWQIDLPRARYFTPSWRSAHWVVQVWCGTGKVPTSAPGGWRVYTPYDMTIRRWLRQGILG